MRRHFPTAVALFLFATVFALPAGAQAPEEFPWEGEVTGNNVNVRSGEGTSFYAITKLHTGDRVLVLGERRGWYRISPPPQVFSYVEKSMVDAAPGGKQGTVRVTAAPVRAGSLLVSSKSTTQLMLSKGATVTILGEADGFYKITPPPAASVYITKQYVKPVAANMSTGLVERWRAANPASAQPAEAPAIRRTAATPEPSPAAVEIEAPMPRGRATTMTPTGARPGTVGAADDLDQSEAAAGLDLSGPPDTVSPADTAIVDVDDAPPITTDAGGRNDGAAAGSIEPAAPPQPTVGRFQALLETVESDLNAMLQKPASERDYASLLTRYQEIADQKDEFVPAEFARIRLTQLSSLAELKSAQVALKASRQEVEEFSARMDARRMEIRRERAQQVAVKFDLEGELRRSFAFPPEKRRYRLVDPARQITIAYVDVPPSVTQNVEYMIGRMVGIHTSGQQYSPAARVPIAIASSITDLTPLKQAPTTLDRQHSSLQPADPADGELPANNPASLANNKAKESAAPAETGAQPAPMREAIAGTGEEEN